MRDVVPVPGRDLAMLVHDDARTVLGLLDMDTESTSPLLGVGKLDSYDFSPSGSHLIGATDAVSRIGFVALDNLHPTDFRLDDPPARVLSTANAKIFVDHGDPLGHATIIPSPTATRDDALVLTGFLTDQPPRPGALIMRIALALLFVSPAPHTPVAATSCRYGGAIRALLHSTRRTRSPTTASRGGQLGVRARARARDSSRTSRCGRSGGFGVGRRRRHDVPDAVDRARHDRASPRAAARATSCTGIAVASARHRSRHGARRVLASR